MEYTLRLNQSGTFQLPPTRVEALYAPEMYGRDTERKEWRFFHDGKRKLLKVT